MIKNIKTKTCCNYKQKCKSCYIIGEKRKKRRSLKRQHYYNNLFWSIEKSSRKKIEELEKYTREIDRKLDTLGELVEHSILIRAQQCPILLHQIQEHVYRFRERSCYFDFINKFTECCKYETNDYGLPCESCVSILQNIPLECLDKETETIIKRYIMFDKAFDNCFSKIKLHWDNLKFDYVENISILHEIKNSFWSLKRNAETELRSEKTKIELGLRIEKDSGRLKLPEPIIGIILEYFDN